LSGPKPAKLALEDGRVFPGLSAGAGGERAGEVVFNTAITGYQEVFTDPSYKGQIVAMTYPHIGNTGLNDDDCESQAFHLEGIVVREMEKIPSNWRSKRTLPELLRGRGLVAAEGVDTRALTRHIRSKGAMRAVLSTEDLDDASLVKKAKAAPGLSEQNLVERVSCEKPYAWEKGYDAPWREGKEVSSRFRVTVYDFGVKLNILRSLREVGAEVTVVPYDASAADVLRKKPDGVLFSNGPGDPENVEPGISAAKKLIGKIPVFGICLGHQILGLALGGQTYKLRFGHHGANHPIKDLRTGKVDITSQNHGFSVDADSLGQDVEATHINLNDQTLEGFRHRSLPVMAVQYHPEAAPGPHDAQWLFGEFLKMMEEGR
jgi:carbamoyl-phosphate synthase small subunit